MLINLQFSFALKLRLLLVLFLIKFRLGEPDDCSGIVSFLSSDEAMYITGETVSVNGGISCRL